MLGFSNQAFRPPASHPAFVQCYLSFPSPLLSVSASISSCLSLSILCLYLFSPSSDSPCFPFHSIVTLSSPSVLCLKVSLLLSAPTLPLNHQSCHHLSLLSRWLVLCFFAVLLATADPLSAASLAYVHISFYSCSFLLTLTLNMKGVRFSEMLLLDFC